MGYLAVPSKASVREGTGYPEKEAKKLMDMMKGKLVMVPIEHDVGPASRYLGCAKMVQDPNDLLVAFDDDIAYENSTISSLACAKRHDPEFSWTGHRFMGLRGFQTGQGADGFMMQAGDLKGFETFIESVHEPCFKVDDLSVSEWLTNYAKRPVKSLEEKQQNVDACGLVKMPIYKANCWTVEDKHNKETRERQICRPTITSVNSLRGDKATGGRGEDMKRCADALAAKREAKKPTESGGKDGAVVAGTQEKVDGEATERLKLKAAGRKAKHEAKEQAKKDREAKKKERNAQRKAEREAKERATATEKVQVATEGEESLIQVAQED